MAWKMPATKGGGGGEKAPVGNHIAVCVAIVDMGTQKSDYQGQARWARRAYFAWELVNEPNSAYKSGRNHVIGIDLNVSLNEKAKLRKFIEARVGKAIPEGVEYDISQELGKPCMLNVVDNGKGYPNVDNVSGIPKGFTVAKPFFEPFLFSLDDVENGNVPTFPDWLPWLYGEKLADVVAQCRELCPPKTGAIAGGGEYDNHEETGDIPY